MSDALPRSASPLTKAQRRVLSYVSSKGAPAALSSRKTAAALNLSRPTVQSAFARLNDLGYLQTAFGKPNRASVHTVLAPGQDRKDGAL